MLYIDNILQKYQKKKEGIITRIISGAFWSFVGAFFQKVALMSIGLIGARILGKQDFAQLSLVRSTISVFVVFGTLGMGKTTTKYISEYRSSAKDKIYNIYMVTYIVGIVFSVLISLLTFIFAPCILNLLKINLSVILFRIGACILFWTILSGIQNGVLTGFEDFKSIALILTISSIIEIISFTLFCLYLGINGALYGTLVGSILMVLLYQLFIKKKLKHNLIKGSIHDIRKSDFLIIRDFGIPAMCSGLIFLPTFLIVKIILVKHGELRELANFEAADQWKMFILFIPSTISRIALPILSNILGKKDTRNYKYILKLNVLINIVVTLIIAIFVIFLRRFLIGFYGKGFSDTNTLIILAISTIFTSVAAVVGSAIASQGRMWTGFSFNCIWAIMFITLSYVFILINAKACMIALALCISYFCHSMFQSLYLYYILKR